MLVYGDRSTERDPRAIIAEMRSAIAALPQARAGIERHAALVAIFVDASGLAQGLADAAFQAAGCDTPTPEQDAVIAVLMTLARAVNASWRSGVTGAGVAAPDLDTLAALPLPERITVKQAEGYAFYALYPEAYADAAQAYRNEALTPAPDMRVIGLRSIGAGLSAMVAAALGARPPITVRPVGHPFARELALSPQLQADLLDDPAARFAIVDEGPGLSGSSLNAVADWLEDHGVAPERIAFFPGHGGDLGHQASARHRARWSRADRRITAFEALALDTDRTHQLAHWVEDLVGPPLEPLRDISGGAWRALRYRDEADWPAVDTFQERRKFLIATDQGVWLLKFSGLGGVAQRKLEQAQALATAGFAPPVVGLRHGFLVQRWEGDTVPLGRSIGAEGPGRTGFVEHLGRYLGFRALRFAASGDDGADLATLGRMALTNVWALDQAAARRLETRFQGLQALQASARLMQVDGRLHAFEWLARPDGGLLKADAVDHAQGHDLIGAQDVGWDVAGASAEFDLDQAEREALIRLVEAHGRITINRELEAAYRLCYLAFQFGARSMAADAHGHWPEEQARLAIARDRYADGLRLALS